MRFRYVGSFLSAATAAALLAGCSGGGSQSATPTTSLQSQGSHALSVRGIAVHASGNTAWLPSIKRHVPSALPVKPFVNIPGIDASGGNQIAISDAINNTVSIYGGGGQVNALLSAGLSEPQGLALDTSATLYVANTANSQVLEYTKPYSSVTATLNDAGQFPAGVAVASDGTVGVTNIISTSGGAGSVSFYAKGSTTPCATVSSGNFARVYFDGFDKSGNLYIDGSDSSGFFQVGEVSGECSATSVTPLTVGNSVNFPGGVSVLSNGDIAIDDQSGSNGNSVVYTYAPPSGGSLGSPIQTTQLTGTGDAVTVAFKQFDNNLWGADAAFADAAKFAYPAGGSAIKTIAGGFAQPIGIAVNPAQP